MTQGLTVTPPGQVVRSVIHGRPVQFFIANPRDAIQRVHASGQFYEAEELEIIRKWCPPGAVFLDIGSNVGNHALYALTFLHAARVVLCEPNPVAIQILMANLGLNGVLDRCDTSKLGFGISDRNEDGMVIRAPGRNLGGGRLEEAGEADAGDGQISLRRGDELLADITPDFIKIDVEGMEISVLSGLSGLIERCRPTFFIEVDNQNRAAFLAWVKENGYAVRARYRRYRANENFLITPDQPRPVAAATPDLPPAQDRAEASPPTTGQGAPEAKAPAAAPPPAPPSTPAPKPQPTSTKGGTSARKPPSTGTGRR